MTTSLASPSARRPRHQVMADPAVRVGDPERQRTATCLGQAFIQGYLSMEEYEARLSRAFEAQTAGLLDHLISDLPVERISWREPRRRAARLAAARRGVQIHLMGYLAMSLLTIGIWLAIAIAAGAWYFWPIWPVLGGGIGIISHAIPVHACARKRQTLCSVTGHSLPAAVRRIPRTAAHQAA